MNTQFLKKYPLFFQDFIDKEYRIIKYTNKMDSLNILLVVIAVLVKHLYYTQLLENIIK